MADRLSEIIEAHLAWLRQYMGAMTAHNWRDMKDYAERQIEALAGALKERPTACCRGLAPLSECRCDIERRAALKEREPLKVAPNESPLLASLQEVAHRLDLLERTADADVVLEAIDALKEPPSSPPALHLCGLPEYGTYEGQVTLVAPDWLKHKWPNGIGVDVCLALEIQSLWRQGIQTSGHCCGHGRDAAYISVWPESVEAMKALGYEPYAHPEGRGDHFIPKTRLASSPPATEALQHGLNLLLLAEAIEAERWPSIISAEAARQLRAADAYLTGRSSPPATEAVPEGWKPIETAPKDGTTVLLFAASWGMTWGAIQTGHFEGDGEGSGQWVTGAGAVEENEEGFDPDAEVDERAALNPDDNWDDNLGPTHWQPLPAHPVKL